MNPAIPVIDSSGLCADRNRTGRLVARRQRLKQIGARLVEACREVGFCYLANHGIPAVVENDAFAAARSFFALDDAVKLRLSIANSPHFRGYTPLGEEVTRGRSDWREQLDLGRDEPVEFVGSRDPPWRRLRGPNQWPDELPALRRAITAWSDAMENFSLEVLRALAVGLGQAADRFDAFMLPHGDPHIKVIRYQGIGSCRGNAVEAPLSQGVGWHNDSGLLTFILQDLVGGLEVRTGGGIVAVEPMAGTYLMNVGEMLQRATAGLLRATEHRVISPPAGTDRISLAYFPHPKYESIFEPIEPSAAPMDRTQRGDNADAADPVHRCFGDNYLKIRLRSHPDVAARFYADVVGGDSDSR